MSVILHGLKLGFIIAIGIGLMACSDSPGDSCQSTEDCFQGHFCSENGVCIENSAPGNGGNHSTDDAGNNGGDNGDDGGNGQYGNQDTGPDSGENDEIPPSCVPDADCSRGVDSRVTPIGALEIRPDDEEYDYFGCVEGPEERHIIGIEDLTFNAETCFDSKHVYRLRFSTCSQLNFVIDIDLIPKSETCGIREFSNVVPLLSLGAGGECESEIHTECYYEHPPPAHGGYRWTLRYVDVFQGSDEFFDIEIIPDEASIPYELVVNLREVE